MIPVNSGKGKEVKRRESLLKLVKCSQIRLLHFLIYQKKMCVMSDGSGGGVGLRPIPEGQWSG